MVRATFACEPEASSSSTACVGDPGESPSSWPRPTQPPFEVLRKTRLSDCYVACGFSGRASSSKSRPPPSSASCPVSLRVSFSRETELSPTAVPASGTIYERLKRRRTWQARLWDIALTHVITGDGRETFEVEVELRMQAVQARLEAAEAASGCPGAADEALRVTREFVSALRRLASRSSEVLASSVLRKRRRIEEAQAADPYLRKAMEAPEVVSELHRRVSAGREALHEAKEELCRALRARCPPGTVEEAALLRFAGQQVARALRSAAPWLPVACGGLGEAPTLVEGEAGHGPEVEKCSQSEAKRGK